MTNKTYGIRDKIKHLVHVVNIEKRNGVFLPTTSSVKSVSFPSDVGSVFSSLLPSISLRGRDEKKTVLEI